MLARIPGALQPARNGIDERMTAALEQALDQALGELEKMRNRKVKHLRKEMRERVDKIESLVPVIEASAAVWPILIGCVCKSGLENCSIAAAKWLRLILSRLAQEVAYLADRSDVSEEMVRLRSHLTQFQEALDSPGETGKMLDFLLQELNREANTTLSKSTDLAIKEAGSGDQSRSRETARAGAECRVK